MPSTYSTNLRLELMADGEKSGTWGTITNTNLGTLLEQAVTGVASVTHDDSASYTLTTNNGSTDEARNAVVLMTGTLTAAREVIVPDVDKVYIFKNGTSGGYDLTFKTSGGSGVTIPNGRAAIVYVDASTGAVNAIDDGYFTDSIFIEGTGTGNFITAESTNAGSASGPDMKMYRNSASPADGDAISKIVFHANTDDGAGGVSVADVEYANIAVTAPETNETTGEAGKLTISLKRGGTTQSYIEIQGGTNSDSDNDSIVFKTGGSTVMTIDNSQNVIIANDLSVDTNTLYVDSSDNVTIAGNNTANYSTTYARGQFAAVNPSSYAAISISAHDTASGNGSFLGFMRSRGTYASPSYVQAGDLIGDISSQAYDFVGGADRYTSSARITFTASENHTATAAGTDITFLSIEDTTKLQYERLSLESDLTVFNEDSRDVDFRVESDSTTHMLFVDAGNNRVGINQSSPSSTLDVAGTIVGGVGATAGGAVLAQTYGGNGPPGTGDYLGIISSVPASGAFKIGYGVYEADYSAYDNFVGGRSSVEFSASTITFRNDTSDTATTVGTSITQQRLFNMNRQEAVFNDDGNNIDFRIESDTNTHAFFVDASANTVGVNTTSTTGVFNVSGESGSGYILNITSGANYQGWYVSGETTYGNGTMAILPNTTPGSGTAQFWTHFSSRTSAGTTIHNVRIDGSLENDGAVTFNQGGGDNDFRVESDSNTHMLFVDASTNNIGINTSTPVSPLVVSNGGASGIEFHPEVSSNFNRIINYNRSTSVYNELGVDAARIEIRPESVRRLSVATSGVIVNEDSRSDTDFRVESDANTHALFVDSVNDTVTIGTDSTGNYASYSLGVVSRNNDAQIGILTLGRSGGDYPYIGYPIRFTGTTGSYTYNSTDSGAAIRFGNDTLNTYTISAGAAGSALTLKTGPYVTAGGTSWTSSSDIRLKNVGDDISGGIEKIKAMRPVNFTWKSDEENKNQLGFIAQEMVHIVPEVVKVPKEEVCPKTGETQYQGIEYEKLVPVLTAALKEAVAKIEDLETRLAALEAN